MARGEGVAVARGEGVAVAQGEGVAVARGEGVAVARGEGVAAAQGVRAPQLTSVSAAAGRAHKEDYSALALAEQACTNTG